MYTLKLKVQYETIVVETFKINNSSTDCEDKHFYV